jgi:spermidine synthase
VQGKSLRSIHVITLGSCAVCAQAVFFREILSLFTGTELILGLLLAAWLFWVGAGGAVGGRLVRARSRRTFAALERLMITAAMLVPASTICIRIGRSLLARPPGELPSFAGALLFSVVVMAPFGFVYGTIYNLASSLRGEISSSMREGITRIYIWEAAGFLAGAVAFSFVLILFFTQLEAAFIVSYILAAVTVLAGAGSGFPTARIAALAAAGAVLCIAVPRIDEVTFSLIYPSYDIRHFTSSRYGEIVVASEREVISFFSGGVRLFSVPEPERTEEFVHIPLLMHPAPRRVLLVGGSLGGGWREAVKHPTVESVDCLELDGELLDLALELEDTLDARDAWSGVVNGRASIGGREVRFIETDGRFHVTARRRTYDVIVLSVPPPINLQLNRYFTTDFFSHARSALNPGGVLAVSHPSSENFLTNEQARILRSIQLTLEDVFRDVVVLPGSTVHFIAGEGISDVNEILPRLRGRNVETRFINENFLPFRFSAERIAFLVGNLSGAGDVGLNTDTRPVTPLYELILEGRRLGSSALLALERLLAVPRYVPVAALSALCLIVFLGARGLTAARSGVWAVGLGSILLQLIVLLAYQSFSGILYHAMVLLTALFMAGAALGALLAQRRPGRGFVNPRLLHVSFAALAVAIIVWIYVVKAGSIPYPAGAAVFHLFSASCGLLTGAYYSAVVRTAMPEDDSIVPATFYAWDLFGACVGGLLGGAILFPVTGIFGTAVFIAVLHVASALFLAGKW